MSNRGRPIGAKSKPQIREFITHADVQAFVRHILRKYKTHPEIAKWLGDQIFGKAMQAMEIGGLNGEPLFDNETRAKTKSAIQQFIGGNTGEGK